MIKNNANPTSERGELLRGAIEHRATWMGLLIDEAKKKGLGTEFAYNAIRRCGRFHGEGKYPETEDLQEFAAAFANQDVIDVFQMEILKNDGQELSIDFHYCPLVAAWLKVGLPLEDMPELCNIAMDGDRGIIDAYDKFSFDLGKTIANGDDMCEIRIKKSAE